MIHYTEMPAMEKNIDILSQTLRNMKEKNEKLFFEAFTIDVSQALEELVTHLEAKEFEKCHTVIQQFYDKNISILFSESKTPNDDFVTRGFSFRMSLSCHSSDGPDYVWMFLNKHTTFGKR